MKNSKRVKCIKRIRSKFGKNNVELLLLKTSQHLYAQINDLSSGKTVLSISTLGNKEIKKNISGATHLGQKLGSLYLNSVYKDCVPVFNRAEYLFHGIVKEFSDSFYNVVKNK